MYDPETGSYTLTFEAEQQDGETQPMVWMTDANGEQIPATSNCLLYPSEPRCRGCGMSWKTRSSSAIFEPGLMDRNMSLPRSARSRSASRTPSRGKETTLVVEVNDNGEVVLEEAKAVDKAKTDEREEAAKEKPAAEPKK